MPADEPVKSTFRWEAGWIGGLAGLLVGLGEGLWAWLARAPGSVSSTGVVLGLALAALTGLAAGVMLGAGLALLGTSWRMTLPAATGPHLRAWLRSLSPETGAQVGGLLVAWLVLEGAALLLVWPTLARLPELVHSPPFRAWSALLLVVGSGVLATILTPLAGWPLGRLCRALRLRLSHLLLGLGVLFLLGSGLAGWLWRSVLVQLPWGWLLIPLAFLALWWLGLRIMGRIGTRLGAPGAALVLSLVCWSAGLGGAVASGEHPAARRLIFRGTQVMAKLLGGIRTLSDVDRDGAAALLGGGDCAPWNPAIRPGARELPGNGLDDDCFGGDSPLQPQAVAQATASPRRPLPPTLKPARNVLLLTVDALRADHLGVYGYSRPTSPVLDELAQQSVVFERFFSPSPCTRWAIPMLHLGRWPSQIAWNRKPWPHQVETSETTLAEQLRRLQFGTGAVWQFRNSFGLRQGFQHWQVMPQQEAAARAPQITDAALRLLEQLAGHRFFLWAHYYDPHSPYRNHGQADLPRFGSRPLDRYDEEIVLTDREIGRLLTGLDRLGLTATTAVIITADHGEAFGEHGTEAHHGTPYNELTRIPLLIRLEGLTPRRVKAPASLLDLYPTILDLVGFPQRKLSALAGTSLIPELTGAGEPDSRIVFAAMAFGPGDPERSRAVIAPPYKLIYDPQIATLELYQLDEDPGETRDLAEAEPELVQRLMGLLIPWMAEFSPEGY